MLAPALGNASSGMGFNGQSASATVTIRIVVQPSVRLLGDAHPQELLATPGRPIEAVQKLTVSTNISRGFCLNMPPARGFENGWQQQLLDGDNISIAPAQGGYTVCSDRNGTFSLVLKHAFSAAPTDVLHMARPVRTELHTI